MKGRDSYHKGHILEYLLMRYLRFEEYRKEGARLRDKVYNYQEGAEFTSYREVKSSRINLEGGREHEIDIWARSLEDGQDLLINVKAHGRKAGQSEVEEFLKVKETARELGVKGYYIFYSTSGFDDNALELLNQHKIMYADGESWEL
ncbi:MAG: hypothetical protein HPY52_10395 [Firmicutes bacterium]|nr:hypothetical protein [Bacillota bacterium]